LDSNFDSAYNRILPLITRVLKRDLQLQPDTVLQADVGMTSLQVMDLVLEIEEEFDISFPLNRLPDIQTIRDLTQEIVIRLDQ